MAGVSMNVTGFDSDKLIQELMNLERRPLILLETRQMSVEIRKSAWDDIEKKLLSLSQKIESITSKDAFLSKASKVKEGKVAGVTAQNDAVEGSYHLEIVALAKSHSVTTGAIDSPEDQLGLSGKLVLNGEILDISSEDNLNTIAQKINSHGELEVNAGVFMTKEGEYRMVLTGGKEGLENQMIFQGDLWDGLGGLEDLRAPEDAIFKINGLEFQRSSNEVTNAIAGVTLELNEEGGSTDFEIQFDDQGAASSVKAFLDEYNSLIDMLSKYTKRDPDSKSEGPLSKDSLTRRLVTDMRQAIFQTLGDGDSKFSFVGEIGISTGKAFSPDGKLHFDKEAFLAQLKENREEVKNLVGWGETGKEGIFTFFKDSLDRYTDTQGFLPLRKGQLAREDKMLGSQIKDKKRILDMRTETLKRQFSGLEVLMQKMNSQGLWLSQQLAGLSFGGM